MPKKPLLAIFAGLLSIVLSGFAAPLADGAPTFSPSPLAQPSPPAPTSLHTPSPMLTSTPAGIVEPSRGPTAMPFLLPALTSHEAALAGRTPTGTAMQAAPPTSAPTPGLTRLQRSVESTGPAATVRPTAEATSPPKPTPTPMPTPKPTPTPEPTPKPTPKPESDYQGRFKFWYPALGVSRGWEWYGCSYGGDPSGLGAGIYRWGCGAKNNVYLMSHAWSTFKVIKQGYHSGALKTGQSAWYADASGKVSEWRVKWVKRVTLDYFNRTAMHWALNDSATPIMTLQTCDGSNDQFRIIVRLVPAG